MAIPSCISQITAVHSILSDVECISNPIPVSRHRLTSTPCSQHYYFGHRIRPRLRPIGTCSEATSGDEQTGWWPFYFEPGTIKKTNVHESWFTRTAFQGACAVDSYRCDSRSCDAHCRSISAILLLPSHGPGLHQLSPRRSRPETGRRA